jgi:hypothetical protein
MSDIIARQAAEILRQDAEIERLRTAVEELRQINRRLVWFVEQMPQTGWGSAERAVWTEFRSQWSARCDQ